MTDPNRDASGDGAPFIPPDDLADPLAPWARIAALVLGVAATGLGCYAVFVSDNQAGTAFLFVTGVVLLLLGLQGTPLRSFGGGDYRIELTRLRRRFAEVVDQAVRQEPPDVAAAVAEAINAIDPGLRIPDFQVYLYDAQVRKAVQ